VALAAAFSCAAWPAPLEGHAVAVERIVTVFVKPEPDRVEVLIRVPLDLLTSVAFPVVNGQLDVETSGAALDKAIALVGDGISFYEESRRVPPTRVAARLSLPSDQSFTDYLSALAQLEQGAPERAAIYPNQGYLDAHLRYPLKSADPMLSIRSSLWVDMGDSVKLAVRYLPPDGSSRSLAITSRSGRVALNPTTYEATQQFFGLGIQSLSTSAEYLLLLACLLVPLRTWRDIVAATAAVTAGRAATLTGTAFNLARVGSWFGDVVGVAIAAALVYVALENVVRSTRRRWVAAGALGALFGFAFSYQLRELLPLAGQHVLVSVLSFDAGIEVAQLVVVAGLAAGVPRLMSNALASRAGLVLLSVITVHIAWHSMLDRATALREAGAPLPDGESVIIVARWIAGIVLGIGAAKYVVRRLEGRRFLRQGA
jgi:hypothetical protein